MMKRVHKKVFVLGSLFLIATLHAQTAETLNVEHIQSPAVNDTPRLQVIDEEAYLNGNWMPIQGATVHWIGLDSGLQKITHKSGLAKAPYLMSHSIRFIVTAPGFISAMGYATQGTLQPVFLYRESRMDPILKSLGVQLDSSRTLVIGKIIDQNMRPVAHVTLEGTFQDPFKVFYSLGSFGLFHKKATQSGPQGDFLISGFSGEGLEYILPTEKKDHQAATDWPASILDLRALPKVLSITIQKGSTQKIQTQVIDAVSATVPEASVQATVGGQRNVFSMKNDGTLLIDHVDRRPSVDLVEVHAQGYLGTWLSSGPNSQTVPEFLPLFTQGQVRDVLASVSYSVNFERGVVFGNLNPLLYKDPMQVRVFGPDGTRNSSALVYYYDENNELNKDLRHSDPSTQRFSISNLPDGEWHVVLVDTTRKIGSSVQVVRVQSNKVSYLKF